MESVGSGNKKQRQIIKQRPKRDLSSGTGREWVTDWWRTNKTGHYEQHICYSFKTSIKPESVRQHFLSSTRTTNHSDGGLVSANHDKKNKEFVDSPRGQAQREKVPWAHTEASSTRRPYRLLSQFPSFWPETSFKEEFQVYVNIILITCI